MPRIKATRPMNAAASRAAGDEFYRAHPEMVTGGRRTPLDPCNPAHAAYREEWLNRYQANGGKVQVTGPQDLRDCNTQAKQRFTPKPAGRPVANCRDKPKPPTNRGRRSTPATNCNLVKVALTCEHGRAAGPQGILMVVPSATGSFGDKISGAMTMKGQCGAHPSWSVGGFWTSSGKGAKFSFNAAKWAPSVTGLFSVKSIQPHVYRINTAACSGAPQSYEVRAYPPGGQSAKIDVRKIVDDVSRALKKLPVPPEVVSRFEKNFFQGAISWSSGWKEDEKSWKAYCEFQVNGGFDPLASLKYKHQIYPPGLVPASLGKWVKAGLFVEVGIACKLNVGIAGAYWPDINKTTWKQKNVRAGGGGALALSLELKLASSEIIEGSLSGESGIDFEASGVFTEKVRLALELKWPGLKCKATLKAAWGYVEYSREWQLAPEATLASPYIDL